LYSADLETNRPASIAKNLTPVYNSLSFFPVATNTWHSVQEVLSTEHQRLSLNGWFHADDAKAAAPPIPEPPVKKIRPVLETTVNLTKIYK
jgi:Rps23 Pro-64 3,4-dihydroxylase Tpa1-like proline 4-hydroxylase